MVSWQRGPNRWPNQHAGMLIQLFQTTKEKSLRPKALFNVRYCYLYADGNFFETFRRVIFASNPSSLHASNKLHILESIMHEMIILCHIILS
jgi:hypothetical protein